MTGVDDPYEEPRTAELVLDTAQVDLDVSVEMSQPCWPRSRRRSR